jgi:alkylhydroperoxidase family enzyme
MHARYLARSGEHQVDEKLAQAAMEGGDDARFTARERAALRYVDVMARDHMAMPDDLWAELMRLFTPEEFMELGVTFAVGRGMGQLQAMLGLSAPEKWVEQVAAARAR